MNVLILLSLSSTKWVYLFFLVFIAKCYSKGLDQFPDALIYFERILQNIMIFDHLNGLNYLLFQSFFLQIKIFSLIICLLIGFLLLLQLYLYISHIENYFHKFYTQWILFKFALIRNGQYLFYWIINISII